LRFTVAAETIRAQQFETHTAWPFSTPGSPPLATDGRGKNSILISLTPAVDNLLIRPTATPRYLTSERAPAVLASVVVSSRPKSASRLCGCILSYLAKLPTPLPCPAQCNTLSLDLAHIDRSRSVPPRPHHRPARASLTPRPSRCPGPVSAQFHSSPPIAF
jgi:hypothetical protein